MFLIAILTASEQAGGDSASEVFGDPTVEGDTLADMVAGQDQAAGEVERLPEGSAVVGMLEDDAVIREQVRTCQSDYVRTAQLTAAPVTFQA